ncbi:MAG: histidine phosphotransferase family protein [Rhodospirillaceae bacterium]
MNDSDLELAQLLCTRLCHDLAGPIGAVAAGVELIGDDPAMADAETIGLIGDSSSAASRKLKFLRAAMGLSQNTTGDLKGLVDGYIAATAGPGARIEVAWPAPAALDKASRAFGANWTQALLNLCLLALEAQPGCRSLELALETGTAVKVTLTARTAGGRAVSARDDLRAAATDGSAAGLNAKTVQAYLAGRMVRAAGGTLVLTSLADGISIRADVPAVS